MPAIDSGIPEFTDHETWLIRSTLDERYGKGKVEAHQVDVELRLSQGDRELTLCPAMYWEEGKCKFVLAKVKEDKRTGDRLYQSQFFYSVRHHYGEESNEYKDLGDCVVNLLKLQEAYEKDMKENPISTDMRGVAGHSSIKGE
jgi:hypothetical protein